MANSAPVKARYKPQNGGWVVTADAGDGRSIAAYGGSLDSARQAIVEELGRALRLYRGGIEVDDELELSDGPKTALATARQARNDALKAAAASNQATAEAARQLHLAGLSLRDIGYLLGVSHTHVHKLLERPPERDTTRKRRR